VKRNDQYNVKRLLVAGAVPEPIHRHYMTPLIWAVQTEQPTIVRLLLEAAHPPISREDITNARKVAHLLSSPHFIVKHLDLALEERNRRARA
jgi:ankyrin repeat protein